jgi:hypothetical protein
LRHNGKRHRISYDRMKSNRTNLVDTVPQIGLSMLVDAIKCITAIQTIVIKLLKKWGPMKKVNHSLRRQKCWLHRINLGSGVVISLARSGTKN